MEKEEINSAPTCEMEPDVFREENENSLPSIVRKLSRDFQDEKDDLGPQTSEENSVVTFTSASQLSQTIKVYLRLKPFPPEIDLTREQECAYTIVNPTTLLTKFPGLDVNTRSLKNLKASERVCRTFTFTTAFGPAISQIELFDEAIKTQIQDFLGGQSSTIMSYGTSNAGKSYTLYGVPSALGIIPLSINSIFRTVEATLSTPWYKPIYQSHVIGLSSTERARELEIRDNLLSFTWLEKTEFVNAYQAIRETMREENADLTSRQNEDVIYSVWISFAEIYNDAIYDLLSSDCHKKRVPLKMVTDKQGRTFIKDLRTVYVNSDEEAYQILLAGQYRSRIAPTTLNSRSSRSHCIFTIKILKYYAESALDDVEVSALSFCDLAGSGRLRMASNIGDRLKETQNINTSLLVLGRCLKSIWEGQSVRQKSELVGPFRESKLTRLFQKALSGKEQITLIVNVNPVPSLYAETQNVLNFSAIAKKIIVEPYNEVKKKMFTSRFSRVVSQSVKTVTDWDHAAVQDCTPEIYHEKVRTSDYVLRECYNDLSTEYEKLKTEYLALKTSMLDKDLAIREEMANTYTGLINDLEANWRSRSKDVEEQQEHLLAWSVSQVENFYKEKLNRLNSRKRRRWDDGDGVDDREADIREMEAENAGLTEKILITKETIKELRSARENAIADKNKAVFELSLVKDEIIGVKKMLEAAENDIRCKEDGAHFTEELKKQLSSREERIKNLKEFLNEAKEEYIRITSDAGQMQEELKEANATLIENAEKIEDLEEQLDQSNIFLMERAKDMEQLMEELERRNKHLAEVERRAKNAEDELTRSESLRLNLMGAVEDLNKLHNIACTRAPQNFEHANHDLTQAEVNINYITNSVEFDKNNIIREITNVELGNSPFTERNRLQCIRSRVVSLEELNSKSIGTQYTDSIVDADKSVYKDNQNSFKLSDSSGINDSGIAVSMGSENQSIEQIDLTIDPNFEAKRKNSQTTCDKNSGDTQLENLQIQYGELTARSLHDTIWVKELSQELEDANEDLSSSEIQTTNYRNNLASIETNLRSVNANKLKRELQFANIITHLETKIDEYKTRIDTFQKELTTRMNKERSYCECLNDKVSRLEKQMSEVNVQVDGTMVTNRFNQHEVKIGKLEKEVCELQDWDDVNLQSTQESIDYNNLEKNFDMLSELKQRVREFEIALVKCQIQENDQHKQLLETVERLSSLESQIQNWPIRELQDTKALSSLQDRLKNDLEITVAKLGEKSPTVDLDLHGSDVENEDELSLKVNTWSSENIPDDFKEFFPIERNSNDEQFENYYVRLQNEKLEHEFKADNKATSLADRASPTAVHHLTAPTSTPRGVDSHSDANPTLTVSLDKTSISSSKSVIPVEKKSAPTKKTLFDQETEDGVDSQSEPCEILNVPKNQNVMAVTRLSKRSEKLNDPGRNISPSLKRPTTLLSNKSVAAPLMQSRWASRKTKPLIRKNEVHVELEPKEESVMRNRKPR